MGFWSVVFGFVAASAIFTYWPNLGGMLSTGIRSAVGWLKRKFSASAAPRE
jgi:hypothetical protein